MKTILRTAFLCICSCMAPVLAYGQIVVHDNVVTFKPQEKLIYTFPIGNTSPSDTLNVQLKAFEVDYSGDKEVLKETQNIILVPRYVQIKPRRSLLVRSIVKSRPKGTQNEKVYRIKFIPSVQKQISKEQAEKPTPNLTTLTSTSMLFIVPAEKIKKDYTVKRNENGIHFENTGNINLIFRQENQCVANVNCKIAGVRLWPGKSWQLNVPKELKEQEFAFEMRHMDKIETLTVGEIE